MAMILDGQIIICCALVSLILLPATLAVSHAVTTMWHFSILNHWRKTLYCCCCCCCCCCCVTCSLLKHPVRSVHSPVLRQALRGHLTMNPAVLCLPQGFVHTFPPLPGRQRPIRRGLGEQRRIVQSLQVVMLKGRECVKLEIWKVVTS